MLRIFDGMHTTLKWPTRGVLLYVTIWVIEGAARKWIPGTGQALYFARDVLAIWMLAGAVLSTHRRSIPKIAFSSVFLLLAAVGLQIVTQDLSPLVAVAGYKSYLSPILLFLFVAMMRDHIKAGPAIRAILYLVPLQLLIAAIQVSSPRNAWINLEVSGDEANFVQSGIVRATGTFSSPSGLTVYLLLAFALALSLFLSSTVILRRSATTLLLLATVLTIALSGSRATILACLIIAVAALWKSVVSGSRSLARMLGVAALIGVALFVVTSVLAPAAFEALVTRFVVASASEDTTSRVFSTALAFGDPTSGSLLGAGAGAHSQAGIALGSGMQWIEVEGDRWTAEMGILGFLLNCGRVLAAAWLTLIAIVQARSSSYLWTTLAAAAVYMLLTGSITANPSTQGAFSITIALIIVSKSRRARPTLASAPQSDRLEYSGDKN